MPFYIKILKTINKILIIIQRSNGDVFFSQTLIESLYQNYKNPKIDLLVNDDTKATANLIPNINFINTFSYDQKKKNRWKQEKILVSSIFMKYDLSISLTASDRSVIYSLLASNISISAIEKNSKKSWWKKLLLSHYYYFDNNKHIHLNNLESLNLLKINHTNNQASPQISDACISKVKNKLTTKSIKDFIIFHPSAQYEYKIYPKHLRNELLAELNSLNIPIIITGGKSEIDMEIKKCLPVLENLTDFIGETSLQEYVALSQLSSAYIGMDTLNMHIAAAQNKRIFAIYGPTKLSMWSPWSNYSEISANENIPLQTYDRVTVFQAEMACVACGMAGCDDSHGRSECLYRINPTVIFSQIKQWSKCLDVEESL
ncbi:glycosyltransferase family 9 protein [Candidatus Pseudothioglobus singularis]|nr:glycosyltransferase family 9 protein [Candidatus Pseudothioglobus singularis]